MKRLTLVIICFALTINIVFADNEVPNPSFEKGPICKPDDISQMDGIHGCDDWENFETSDWLTDKVGNPCLNFTPLLNGHYDVTGFSNGDRDVPNLPVLDAYHGDYFAGFGTCEGIQVKLKNEVGGINKMVRISFWFSPRSREDTKIIVYLLKQRANGIADCTFPGINTEVSFEVEVNSSGTDAIHHPGNWYYFEKVIFPCPGDPVYEYLAVKGENGILAPGECCYNARRYIYVDDFNLEEEDFCNHPCANNSLGGCFMLPSANDSAFPNATSGSPVNGLYWSVALHNILGYKFTVFDGGWDGVYDGDPGIYYIEEFDPNGLSYNGGPWVISWTGENNLGNCVQVGFYPIVIEFWNCTNHVYVFGKVIYYLGDGCSFIAPLSTPCFDESDCNQRICDPTLILNTPPTQTLYPATSFIYAYGQFNVPAQQRVDLTAGDEIVISDGFVAEEGAEFRARIAPCEINSQRVMSGDSSSSSVSDPHFIDHRRRNDAQKFANDSDLGTNDYVSTGLFTISTQSTIYNIIVYDQVGRSVKNSSTNVIDLSDFANGIYVYQVIENGYIIESGKLVKLDQ